MKEKDDIKEIYDKDKFEEYDRLLEAITPAAIYQITKKKKRKKNKAIILATLLNLEMKKIIRINKDKIEVLDPDNKSLKSSEKYILSLIKDGIVDVVNKEELEKIFEKDAKECYLYIGEKNAKAIKNKIMFYVGLDIFAIIYSLILYIIYPKFLVLFLIILIPSLLFLLKFGKKIYITKIGKKVLKTLKNLKSELYGLTNDEMVMWPNYRIYALLLDCENANFIFRKYGKFVKIEEFGNRISMKNG